MIYTFDDYELDTGTEELRLGGVTHALEPRVFALLSLLVENRDRLLSRDELIEKVWDNRVVSDAAVASCIKSARRAVGDDGVAQRIIRTVHGRGVRFVANAGIKAVADLPHIAMTGSVVQAPERAEPGHAGRPSIAVLPLNILGDQQSPHTLLADAIPHELITSLARLRWMFVIARGSSFRFRQPAPDVIAIGKALRVRYCLSGSVEISGNRIAITTELCDTHDGEVLWGERYALSLDEVQEASTRIVGNVVNVLELQIPLHEARLARPGVSGTLDAWSAYHLGLQHTFRFNRHDNRIATDRFERAVALDPHFGRAHAGLSFTHFQSAFLRYSAAPADDALAARRAAEKAVEIDPADPFANFTMGRTYWLNGDMETSLTWLDRAIVLCPSYAQGIYARAWAQTIAGRSEEGQRNADMALTLSPLDPFVYAMLGTRSLAHAAMGEFEQAAHFGERAARSPGAHVLIALIACVGHVLAGNRTAAEHWAANARQRRSDISVEEFLLAFPLCNPQTRQRVATALAELGF